MWIIVAYFIALPSGDYTDKLPQPEVFSDYELCLSAADAMGIIHYARGSALVYVCERDPGSAAGGQS